MPTLTLIPALLAVVYAVINKVRHHKISDAVLMTIGGCVALGNALIIYEYFTGEETHWSLRCIQQVLACMIIPLAYMFFVTQIGRNRFNATTIVLWALLLPLLIPAILIPTDGNLGTSLPPSVNPMTIHFLSGGSIIHSMYTADIITLLQAIFVFERIIALTLTMRRYRLSIPSQVRYYIYWWVAVAVFATFASMYTTQEFHQPNMTWAYFIGFSAMMIFGFIVMSLNIDLHLLMRSVDSLMNPRLSLQQMAVQGNQGTAQGTAEDTGAPGTPHATVSPQQEELPGNTTVNDLDNFILQYRLMADRVRTLMANKKYLDPSFNADAIIQYLGTDPIYFTRMMKMEFGCSFSDYVTAQRLSYAEHLLKESDADTLEVARKSGFEDERSFTVMFRQKHGISPTQYRES